MMSNKSTTNRTSGVWAYVRLSRRLVCYPGGQISAECRRSTRLFGLPCVNAFQCIPLLPLTDINDKSSASVLSASAAAAVTETFQTCRRQARPLSRNFQRNNLQGRSQTFTRGGGSNPPFPVTLQPSINPVRWSRGAERRVGYLFDLSICNWRVTNGFIWNSLAAFGIAQ